MNLLKSLVGSGNLALPVGVAAFSWSQKAVVPAVWFCLFFSLLSAYSFMLIARVCNATGSETYPSAWASSVSAKTEWLPAVAILLKTFLACVSYLMIIGDCFSAVLAPFHLPPLVSGRNPLIILIAWLIIFPMCNLKSLAALAKFSVVGTAAAMYTLFVVVARCVDGSYAAGGALLGAAPFEPQFETFVGPSLATAMTPATSVVLCTLANAFTNHYMAPSCWAQLDPGTQGRKLRRMAGAAFAAFLGAWLYFSFVMGFGFLTFGGASQGMILNNYAVTDVLAAPARAALGLSVLTSFPIVFFNFRTSTVGMMPPSVQEFYRSRPVTFTALLTATVVPTALVVRDLGALAALTGAVFASYLLYIAPPLMAMQLKRRGALTWSSRRLAALEAMTWTTMIPTGVVLAVVGAVSSVR